MAQNLKAGIRLEVDKTGNIRAFDLLRGDVKALNEESKRTNQQLANMHQTSQRAAASFDQFRAAIGQTVMYTGIALGISAIATALGSVYAAGNKVVGLQASLTATFGMAQVGTEMDYVRKVADDLGLEMLSLGDAYSKWAASAKGTVLEGKQQKAIFEAVAQSSRVLNLSVEDTEGTLRALSQMISKGKVQAEELRGQLGERLPGAFQMAARAMGVTTAELDKMLQDGKVLAQDLLPKLAVELNKAYGGDARAMAVQSLSAETNRLKNSLTELSLSIYAATAPTLADWARTASVAIEGLAQNSELLLVPLAMVGTYLAGKGAAALAGYVTATYAKIAADQASIASDMAKSFSTTQLAAKQAQAAQVTAAAEAKAANALAQRLLLARQASKADLVNAQSTLKAAQSTEAYTLALARLKTAQAASAVASTSVIAAREKAAAASTAAATATSLAAAKQADAAKATAILNSQFSAGAAASRAFGGALALVGGPLGALVIAVGALTFGLSKLAEEQAEAGKSIKTLDGEYLRYEDITKKVLDLNTEYLTASAQRREAIEKETLAIKNNTQAEIDVFKARLAKLQGNRSKAASADANDPDSPSLAAIYDKEIAAQIAKIEELEAKLKNVNVTIDANSQQVAVNQKQIIGHTQAVDESTTALNDQAKQFGLTKEQQDALTDSYKRSLDTLSAHENRLKTLVENLQKQRIELEHGSAATKYYEDRLSGLSDAEAKAAANSDQYNNYLKERNRLQQEAAGISGGLLDEYNAKLKDLGLNESALDFSGIVDQTDAAVAAADNYKNALQGAEDVGRNLGENISKSLEQAAKSMQGVDHGFKVALGNMAATQEKAISTKLGSTLAEMRKQMAQHVQELNTIDKVAAQTGTDATMMKTMAWIESRFNGAANRGEKGAKGLYQFVPDTAKDYGIRGSELNIESNTRAYVELLKDNMGQLRKFGIEINGANLYLAHQMGAEGLRQIRSEAQGTGRISDSRIRGNMLNNPPVQGWKSGNAQEFLSLWQEKYAKFEAGIRSLTGGQSALAVQTQKTAVSLNAGAVASDKTNQSAQAQLTAVRYMGGLDQQRVTDKQREALIAQHMSNEAGKLVKSANDQIHATQQSGYELRQNQLIQKQFNDAAQEEILTRESMADYLAEERNIRLQMASIRDPNAAYKAELAEKRLTDTQKQALMDQKAALEGEKVIKGLEDQALALQQNGQEQYATQLKAQGLSGAYLEQAKAMNYANTVVSIRKNLDLELKNTGLDEYQQYYNELIEQGIAANDAYAFSQQKQLIAFGNLKKELEDEYKLIGLNNIQKYEAQKLAEGMSAAHAKEAAALYQRNRVAEATTAANDAFYLAQQAIGKTDEQLRALVLTQSEGYPKSVADSIAATEKQTSSLEKYRSAMQDLTKQRLILEARLQGGDKAARAVELGFEYANQAQRDGIQLAEEHNKKLEETVKIAQSIGDELADALMSGDWGKAGDNILNILKGALFDPIKKNLSTAISTALNGANGQGGGLLGKLLNFDGINSAVGGVGSSIGGLFSGIASSAANGFTGIGTAISGGLSGIMGSFGTLVSAIPGWGWALAGVAALSKIFGKKDGNLVFGQGMQTGQQLTGQGGHNGQEHYRETALGLIGATSGSNKIGREKDFVPKFHEALDAMKALDDMIAKSLPNSVDKFKAALSGLQVKGFSLEQIMQQRYSTVLKALPDALQKALTAGKDITAMSAEEIISRFKLIEAATTSGLIPALESMNWAAGKSKDDVLALAIGLSNAAGSMDALKTKLDAYYQAAYTEAERTVLSQQQAKTVLDEYNKQLGLSGNQYIDSIAKLRERIEAEDKTTEAGQKNIGVLLNMVEALKTFSGTADDLAAKLKGQWSDFNAAAYTDSQREGIAKKQAQKLVDQFNQTYGTALKDIIDLRQLMRTIDTTTAAGKAMQQAALGLTGSLVTLGGTAQQIKEKIAGLRDGIKNLVGDLYGKTTNTTTNTSSQTAAQSALDAAEAALESLRSRYDDEKQWIDDLNNAAQEAYREELARYEQLKQLAVDLREYIAGFKRSNELLTPLQKLQEVQAQYSSTLALAKTGDADAVKNIQGLADELKQSYLDVYASSKPSQDKIAQIMADLTGLAGVLDGMAGYTPNQPGSIGSTTLASLEQQIAAQQATISSLQSQLSSSNSSTAAANAAADRVAMAQELAGKIGQLGLATDKSAWDILKANGVNINALAADFGINVKQLDSTFVGKVAELSGLLNVNSLQLLGKIGVSATDLATAYGINADKLDKTMIGKIGGLASQLNVNSFDLLKKLGVTSQELASAYGLNTDKLNQAFLTKLDSLADILHVDSVTLAQKFGVNIDTLGNLMANKLAALPNLPADIKAGLAPHLQDIRNAADPATLQKELRDLQAYVNSLPPGIKGQLNAQLAGILGYTGDTKTNTGDTKTETMALRNVSGRITDLTIYTRNELTGQYITKMLQNSRALNQNAANIGKSAIASYRVGTDGLRGDQVIQAHDREIIFSPSQSDSVRDQVIYMMDYMPRAMAYIASNLAANATHYEPLDTAPAQVMHFSPAPQAESNSEFLGELKRLRESNEQLLESNKRLEKQVEKLSKERSQDAHIDHEQRDVLINQNQASLSHQEHARRDAWRDARQKN